MQNTEALDAIGKSDVWYLLTDGDIWGNDVQVLCNLAAETGVLDVPVIFVITGPKTTVPSDLNVSVGISFFANASNVLILFKAVNSEQVYALAGKGCFAKLDPGESQTGPNLTSWDNLRIFDDEKQLLEACFKEDIHVPSAGSRPKIASGLINIGKWENESEHTLIDLDLLLKQAGEIDSADLQYLLAEHIFNKISLACKTRGRVQELRALLLRQKVEKLNLKLQDVSGAAAILKQLSNQDLENVQRTALQQRLRDAHAKNRRQYQHALDDLKASSQERVARHRNNLVNSSLEQLAEVESAGYTADILERRSNRARRAALVSAGGEISISSLDLDTPIAFRGKCNICCMDNEVMGIAVKAGADGAANTDDFALNFPLAAGRSKSNGDLISSQLACFQCALACEGKSIYREDVSAVIPTLDYTGSNKKYIQEQLYLALTSGLRTGASGASQLFMTILDTTVKTKAWAAFGANSEDPDIAKRHALLRWMLLNMLEKTGCRETFDEHGPWVTFPEALAWAAKDFRAQGLDSWFVGYPSAGFMQMIAFGQEVGVFDKQTIEDLRKAKLLHSITSAYLARLAKNGHHDGEWKQPLLATVYAEFQRTLVPFDRRGKGSLINSTKKFWHRLCAFLTSDSELLAGWDAPSQERAMRRVQLLAFWLVYHQREHTRAKTFFQKLRSDQPLSHIVLDAAGAAISQPWRTPFYFQSFVATQLLRTSTLDTLASPLSPPRSVPACCDAAFQPARSRSSPWKLWQTLTRPGQRRSSMPFAAAAQLTLSKPLQ